MLVFRSAVLYEQIKIPPQWRRDFYYPCNLLMNLCNPRSEVNSHCKIPARFSFKKSVHLPGRICTDEIAQ